MRTVLVTGARGFIGRHTLAPLAARGFEVHAITTRPAPADARAIIWHRADLLDVDAGMTVLNRVRPDAMLHLAWAVEHGAFWTDPRNSAWLNASVVLLKRFAELGGRRAVVAGTCAEYDWTALGDGLCREHETPLRPRTVYGQAKLEVLRALETDPILRNLQFGWGRLFQMYGPDEQPGRLVPSVICSLLRAKPARTTSGRQVRDFMDVRDAAEGLVALLSSEARGAVNIASGEALRVMDLVKLLGEITDRPELVQFGAVPDRPDEPPVLVADVRLLREKIGFRRIRPLHDGLRDAVAWWRENLAHRTDI